MKEELENKLEEKHFKIIQLKEENENILNSYNCIKKDYIKLTRENNKYKEVLDKIKEYCNNRLQYYNEMERDYGKSEFDYAENDNENILELLEEIE